MYHLVAPENNLCYLKLSFLHESSHSEYDMRLSECTDTNLSRGQFSGFWSLGSSVPYRRLYLALIWVLTWQIGQCTLNCTLAIFLHILWSLTCDLKVVPALSFLRKLPWQVDITNTACHHFQYYGCHRLKLCPIKLHQYWVLRDSVLHVNQSMRTSQPNVIHSECVGSLVSLWFLVTIENLYRTPCRTFTNW